MSAVAGQRLVDRVVDDLPDEVVQAALAGRADVHAGALAHRLEALEDGDLARVVVDAVGTDVGGSGRSTAGVAGATVSGTVSESGPVELGVVLGSIGSSASDTSLLGGQTSCGRPDVDVEPQPLQSNGPAPPTVPSDARNGHFPGRKPLDPRGGSRQGASAPFRRLHPPRLRGGPDDRNPAPSSSLPDGPPETRPQGRPDGRGWLHAGAGRREAGTAGRPRTGWGLGRLRGQPSRTADGLDGCRHAPNVLEQ